ncbi:MAG: response regulator [Cytophagaceae bacterium]
MNKSIVEILLIEDNHDDAGLTIRALKKHNLSNNLLHIDDGEEALNYLFSPESDNHPKLILLDLKLPKVDGLEILRKLKADTKKKNIPVVVLTSSREEQDIIKSYDYGVNAYVVKPVEFDKFIKAVSDLGLFWMIINEVPKQ